MEYLMFVIDYWLKTTNLAEVTLSTTAVAITHSCNEKDWIKTTKQGILT